MRPTSLQTACHIWQGRTRRDKKSAGFRCRLAVVTDCQRIAALWLRILKYRRREFRSRPLPQGLHLCAASVAVRLAGAARRFARPALLLSVLCLAACHASANPQGKPTSDFPVASEARLESHGEAVRLTLTLSRPVAANAFVMAGPDRVIVDLPSVNFQILQPRVLASRRASSPASVSACSRRTGPG